MFPENVGSGDGVQDGQVDLEGLSVQVDADGNLVDDPEAGGEVDTDESAEILRRSIEATYAENASKPAKKTDDKGGETREVELGDEVFFAGDIEALEKVVTNPVEFNKLLNAIYKKAVQTGHNLAVENMMRSAPEIVKSQVNQQITLTKAVSKFYEDNDDLASYKQTVAAIATKVTAENPQLPLAKVFEVTAQVARKRLGLAAKAKGDDKGTPRFPKKPTGNRGGKKEDLTGQAKEIDEMLNALGQ